MKLFNKNKLKSNCDPFGSYTGVFVDNKNEKPVRNKGKIIRGAYEKAHLRQRSRGQNAEQSIRVYAPQQHTVF